MLCVPVRHVTRRSPLFLPCMWVAIGLDVHAVCRAIMQTPLDADHQLLFLANGRKLQVGSVRMADVQIFKQAYCSWSEDKRRALSTVLPRALSKQLEFIFAAQAGEVIAEDTGASAESGRIKVVDHNNPVVPPSEIRL